jgi:hypothetical protein
MIQILSDVRYRLVVVTAKDTVGLSKMSNDNKSKRLKKAICRKKSFRAGNIKII